MPNDNVEAPIEAYEQRQGLPYIVDLLDVANVYREMGYQDAVKNIDAYVLAQIAERGLKSTKQSYEAVIHELERQLMLDENLEFDKRLEKLSGLATIMRSQNVLDKMRKRLGE